jgi:hypothetical protein
MTLESAFELKLEKHTLDFGDGCIASAYEFVNRDRVRPEDAPDPAGQRGSDRRVD